MSDDMQQDADELDDQEHADTLPDLLKPDATTADIIDAVNGLAVETQLIRKAHQETGMRIGAMDAHISSKLGDIELLLKKALSKR